MRLSSRKLIDKMFSGSGILSIVLMSLALFIILLPVFYKGSKAFIFKGTIEYRRMMLEKYKRGNESIIQNEIALSTKYKEPIYKMLNEFEKEIKSYEKDKRSDFKKILISLKKDLKDLLGPFPNEIRPVLWRYQYGQTRLDKSLEKLKRVLFIETWDYSNVSKMGEKVYISRKDLFKGTKIEPLFDYLEENYKNIFMPKLTFYWRFLFDESHDAHFFGGIWPELLGTFYLTVFAMIFAVPVGIFSAVYLTEYAKKGVIVSFLRSCISTLAGVPSIVFGLFGLAFFINTLNISESKSVLAGSLTLALLILPTIIRASEEAIRAVPKSYKEASLSLGATKWHTVFNVILPASLPGILTGIVISMGRAAGETAPIIFTAAVSVGNPLKLAEVFTHPTPALSWNIYNLCTEHEAVDEIRHVQFGMVLTLVLLVLILNMFAIIMRARITKKLRG